jgi:phosphopantothenoylcysteine decarboxylase/phosphopantothenate--cysteine ligase
MQEGRDAPKVAKAIPLVANPDLLAELGPLRARQPSLLDWFRRRGWRNGQALIERARAKLVEKACDVVVANEVGRPGIGFGADENAVTLVFRDGRVIDLPPARKELLAQTIWDKIAQEFAAPPRKTPNLEEPKTRS